MANLITKIPKFRRCVLQNFPFIEQDFDALTDYQLLCKVVEYLNNVINSQNELIDVTESFVAAFNELHSYVEHYFDNLDVQEEINNKIDDMVSDGTFEEIIGHYFREQFNILDQKIDDTAETLENQFSLSITAETNARTNADTNLQAQINALGSGSPIPVSSTSAMTNHNKVYVNTTDGKWYYWNGSAWTAGGTYQANGIASGSVVPSSLDDKVSLPVFEKSTDIGVLGLLRYDSSVANAQNVTTPMLIKAGTTVTFSDDFVSNYQWHFVKVRLGSCIPYQNINSYTTDTSYTFTNDEFCILVWKPIDNNWSSTTYTVDLRHKLDSGDVESITFYYPRYNTVFSGIKWIDYEANCFGCRTFDSSGNEYFYSNNRFGTLKAISSPEKLVINMRDSRFNLALIKVAIADSGRNYYSVISDSGWKAAGTEFEVEPNTLFIISMRAADNSNVHEITDELVKALEVTAYPTFDYVDSIVNQIPTALPDYDRYVKGINHRGYNTVAPENTIPAFKLSAKNGFKYVESDVQFTSDSVPVMIHDSTIDRTSDGTGNVKDMTYAQISQYDFGSWKSSAYTGTKIPTLYEFLECCKECGLTPYIELKTVLTDAQCNIIENALKQYGMINDATFISFMPNELTKMHNKIPQARIGLIANYDLTDHHIDVINSLKGDENEVFIDLWTNYISDDNVNKCLNANIPLEVWTPDTDQDILDLPNYVTGVTSNIKIAGKVYYDNALS